jgi:hypothetical protein
MTSAPADITSIGQVVVVGIYGFYAGTYVIHKFLMQLKMP